MKRHEVARNRAQELSGERCALLEPTLPRRISERMMKRVISMLRDATPWWNNHFRPRGECRRPLRKGSLHRPQISVRRQPPATLFS